MKISTITKLSLLAEHELRMGEESREEWDVPLNKTHGLIDLAEEVGLKDKVICEIGCFLGVSTETFALFEPQKLYAIDLWGMNEEYTEADWAMRGKSWKDIRDSFEKRMNNYKNIEIIQDFSINASKRFDNESLDMVYIDGEHSYSSTKEDIMAWLPKIKQEGYICGHDYYNDVKLAVDECAGERPVGKYIDTSWIFKK